MKRPVRKQTITPAKRLVIKQTLIGTGLALFVTLLLTAVWYGTRLSGVTISSVQVNGAETVDAQMVTEGVTNLLDQSYIRLIPKRFTFLYPESAILAQVQDIPRVATVEIARPSWRELEIYLTEHSPTALWCEVEAQHECLFMNESGYAFAAAPQLRGGSFMRYSSVGRDPEIGERLLPAAEMHNLEWLTNAIADNLQLYPALVQVYPDNRVTAVLTTGGELYMTLNQDVTATMHYLESLIGSQEFSHLQSDWFQYIDLRFGNRLFVNEALVVSTSTDVAAVEPVYLGGEASVESEVATSALDEVVSEGDALEVQVVEPIEDDLLDVSTEETDFLDEAD